MKRAAARTPAASREVADISRPDAQPFPVLLYHSVHDNPPTWIAPFTVKTDVFERQLDLVVDSGRTPITARQAVDALHGGPPLPERPVLITFDDGFQDFADTALPALRERGLPSTLFVTTGALAPRNDSLLPPARMMRREAVIAVAQEGVEIGAHSHTHPQLDTLPPRVVALELRRSKDDLEDMLGDTVTLLAYPHGYSDARTRALARSTGYDGAFAVRNALSCAHDEPFRIARLTVCANTSTEQFARWLRSEGVRVASRRESTVTKLWRNYRRAGAFVSTCGF